MTTPIPSGDYEAPQRPAGAHAADGYVYIVGFGDGTLKVGRSLNPARRLAAHTRDGAKFGISAKHAWVSPLHRGYVDSEKMLKLFCAARGTLQHGSEYFSGLSISDVKGFASTLSLTPSTPAQVEADEAGWTEAREKVLAFRAMPGKRPAIHTENETRAALFAHFLDEHSPLPANLSEDDSASLDDIYALAMDTAASVGLDPYSVPSWTWLNYWEHVLDISVASAKRRLRARVLDEGRLDLLAPMFEDMPTPTTPRKEVSL